MYLNLTYDIVMMVTKQLTLTDRQAEEMSINATKESLGKSTEIKWNEILKDPMMQDQTQAAFDCILLIKKRFRSYTTSNLARPLLPNFPDSIETFWEQ